MMMTFASFCMSCSMEKKIGTVMEWGMLVIIALVVTIQIRFVDLLNY